ncbi:hypothetical protein P409_34880, partial [Inquilinus limosus MP06]
MMHPGEGLQPAQRRHPHAADGADLRQVVAQQVDDHQVLGPVFRAGLQLHSQDRIRRRIDPARPGALDRPGLDPPGRVDRQEPLRRGAGDPPPLAQVEEGGEGRGRQGAQAAMQREGVEPVRQVGQEALGQVGLVDVAGGDPVADPADA